MSWTYSGDPASNEKDEYRFLIGDVDETDQLISDEEIEYVLAKTSNKNLRLYLMYQKVATVYAKEIKNRLGPQSEDPTERTRYFQALANKYAKLCYTGAPVTASSSDDTIFTIGMMDNEQI